MSVLPRYSDSQSRCVTVTLHPPYLALRSSHALFCRFERLRLQRVKSTIPLVPPLRLERRICSNLLPYAGYKPGVLPLNYGGIFGSLSCQSKVFPLCHYAWHKSRKRKLFGSANPFGAANETRTRTVFLPRDFLTTLTYVFVSQHYVVVVWNTSLPYSKELR